MKKKLTLLLAATYFCGFAQESSQLTDLKVKTDAQVSMNPNTATPSFIRFHSGKSPQLKSKDPVSASQEFISENYRIFNLKNASDLVFISNKADNYGLHTVTYQQNYQGIPVYAGLLKFNFNATGKLTSINGNIISKIGIDSAVPKISKEQAASAALSAVTKQKENEIPVPLEVNKNTLYVFPKGLAQGTTVTPHLVYEVEVTNRNNIREFVFIDAINGEIVDQFTGIHNLKDRELYEVSISPSNLKWKEGDEFPGELNIWQQNEIVVSGHIYNLFKNSFGYVSYDGNDHKMITINNNPNISCPNANWNGTSANYCDGTAADDVVAHEWGHAYTEYTSGLIYQYQAGALNESYSDVWGETVDLLNNYEDDGENLNIRTTTACSGTQRWKMGEDATAFGSAIRDMWNPTCNGDPGSVISTNYYCGEGDSGGVHTNSGVPNHLYALLVDGGTYNGYSMTSIGFIKAAHLWWRAQSAYLTPTSSFIDFADALEAAANDLIDINLEGLSTTETAAGLSGQVFTAADLQSVKNGIFAVQLRTSPAEQCGYEPILSSIPELCDAATTAPIFKEDFENGLQNWTISHEAVNPDHWEERNWKLRSNLPGGRSGSGVFAPDPINGDCETNLQNGVISLESPLITLPDFTEGTYQLTFHHYVATENRYDGGNIKYSLNGGEWTIVPISAFEHNQYNTTLVNSGNDNPLRGQRAFSGTDGGSLGGSWGQSVVNLSEIGVTSGSTIQFKFDFGTDGCNGNDGWYIDDVVIYNCAYLAVQNIDGKSDFSVYPNPTSGVVTIRNTKKLRLKTAELYDVSGKLLKVYPLSGSAEANLDVSFLQKGNYILKVNSDTTSSTAKIIKK